MRASEPNENIEALEEKLLKIVMQKQDILLREILNWTFSTLNFGSGGLEQTAQNYSRVITLDYIFREFIATELTDVEEELVNSLFSVNEFNKKWFAQFVNRNTLEGLQRRVADQQLARLGIDGRRILDGGTLADITRSMTPIKRIKARIIQMIQLGAAFPEISNGLELLILSSNRVGVLAKSMTLILHDTLSQFDRGVSREVAVAANLEFFLYQGGKVKDTRDFCDRRDGKVFHISETEEWKAMDWDGKSPEPYDPITDMGGYNCRHLARFISNNEAERRGKNIAEFL